MSGGEREGGLRRWLEAREPPPPAELVDRLLEGGQAERAAAADVASLLEEARTALASALSGEGERRGAFRLLAADAWITWACEEALAADDPEAALLDVVRAVVGGGTDGS